MGVFKKTGHDDVIVPADNPGDVLYGFPFPYFNVVGTEIQGMASESKKSRFKGKSRPRGRFGKNHGQAVVFERLVVLSIFQLDLDLRGKVKGFHEFILPEIRHV